MPENTTLSFEPQLNCPWQWLWLWLCFFSASFTVSRLWRLFGSFFPLIMQTPSNIKQRLMQFRNKMESKLKKKQCMLLALIRTEVICWSLLTCKRLNCITPKQTCALNIKYSYRGKCIQIPGTCALKSQTDTSTLWIHKSKRNGRQRMCKTERDSDRARRYYHTHNPKCQIPKGN